MLAFGWTARGAARHKGIMSLMLAMMIFLIGAPSAWAAAIERVSVTPERVTIAFDDYVSLGGEGPAREAGKLRQEGKEYVVQDGDVLLFKFIV